MAIQIITPTTAIRPGQFVCAGKSLSYGNCAGAREVLEVKETRIYLVKEERNSPTFSYRSNLLYLCDTRAEADAVFELIFEREQARIKAMEEASAKVSAAYMPKMRALLGAFPPKTAGASGADEATEARREQFERMVQSIGFESGEDVFADHHDGKRWNELLQGEYDSPVLRDAWAVFCAAQFPPNIET
jgi:hypothetical protein